jgi:hypothetical protein
MAALVLHTNPEAIHHGAEILVLRDLYTTAQRSADKTTLSRSRLASADLFS